MNAPEETPPLARPASVRRRADARLNDERVFAAALEVFGAHGLQATVPQVAERAGVGKATVYRTYPAKDDLVEALLRYRLAELEREVAPSLEQPTARGAFTGFVLALFEHLAQDRLLSEALAERPLPQLFERLTTLMEAAKTDGSVREDATVFDLRVVLCGPALQLVRVSERDPALWRRYAEMTLRALRPCGAEVGTP